MNSFVITLPDDLFAEVVAAVCAAHGFVPKDPSSIDESQVFTERLLRSFLLKIHRDYTLAQARKDAEEIADAEVRAKHEKLPPDRTSVDFPVEPVKELR